MLGFIQALVWIFAVANAVKHLNSPLHVIGYAGGYATGTFVGVSLEQAIAYGVATVRIVTKQAGAQIAEALRQQGYGVTEYPGIGRDGNVEIVHSVVQRSHLSDVLNIVNANDQDAFVTVEEPKVLSGGIIATREWPVRSESTGLKSAVMGWARAGRGWGRVASRSRTPGGRCRQAACGNPRSGRA